MQLPSRFSSTFTKRSTSLSKSAFALCLVFCLLSLSCTPVFAKPIPADGFSKYVAVKAGASPGGRGSGTITSVPNAESASVSADSGDEPGSKTVGIAATVLGAPAAATSNSPVNLQVMAATDTAPVAVYETSNSGSDSSNAGNNANMGSPAAAVSATEIKATESNGGSVVAAAAGPVEQGSVAVSAAAVDAPGAAAQTIAIYSDDAAAPALKAFSGSNVAVASSKSGSTANTKADKNGSNAHAGSFSESGSSSSSSGNGAAAAGSDDQGSKYEAIIARSVTSSSLSSTSTVATIPVPSSTLMVATKPATTVPAITTSAHATSTTFATVTSSSSRPLSSSELAATSSQYIYNPSCAKSCDEEALNKLKQSNVCAGAKTRDDYYLCLCKNQPIWSWKKTCIRNSCDPFTAVDMIGLFEDSCRASGAEIKSQ